MNVLIDASSRILYASYYIQGLYEVFGKKNVSFSSRYFKDLKRDSIEYSFEHYFTFVLIDAEKNLKKIVIDFCDPPDINSTAYKWCDAYAKINLNYSETKDEDYEAFASLAVREESESHRKEKCRETNESWPVSRRNSKKY